METRKVNIPRIVKVLTEFLEALDNSESMAYREKLQRHQMLPLNETSTEFFHSYGFTKEFLRTGNGEPNPVFRNLTPYGFSLPWDRFVEYIDHLKEVIDVFILQVTSMIASDEREPDEERAINKELGDTLQKTIAHMSHISSELERKQKELKEKREVVIVDRQAAHEYIITMFNIILAMQSILFSWGWDGSEESGKEESTGNVFSLFIRPNGKMLN